MIYDLKMRETFINGEINIVKCVTDRNAGRSLCAIESNTSPSYSLGHELQELKSYFMDNCLLKTAIV